MNKRSKKVYAITDEGVEFYKNHIADYVDNLKKTKYIRFNDRNVV